MIKYTCLDWIGEAFIEGKSYEVGKNGYVTDEYGKTYEPEYIDYYLSDKFNKEIENDD